MSSEPEWLLKKIEEARAEGRIISDSHAKLPEQGGNVATPDSRTNVRKTKKCKPKLIESIKVPRKSIWYVGVETRSEGNLRSWQGRSRRADSAWTAVRKAIRIRDLAYYEDETKDGMKLYARFTRLAPRSLDKFVNLPASLKAVEDVVCFLIGLDDSSPLWNPVCDQEQNDAMGVRIELSLEPF